MTVQQRTSEPPVSLSDPTRPPRPAPGCDVCATLERDRIRAERTGNIKLATTCEVEIRNHPHPESTARPGHE